MVLTADTYDGSQDALVTEMNPQQFIKVPVTPPGQHSRLRYLLGILRSGSRLVDIHRIKNMQKLIDDVFARDHYDVVLFESVFMADYRLPKGTRVMIDQHNIEHELLYRTYQSEKSFLRKWYNWWESRQVKRFELNCCRNAQGVLVTSEREALLLKPLLPDSLIAVVPNGVDTEAFQQVNLEQEVPDRIVFTGSMDYYPNVGAVLYFARECWPLIRRSMPTATWQIVGKNPPPVVQDLARRLEGVSVTGSVPDVKPYIAAATVAIAPLLIGSGTRLKILEALAMGKAVVSTSLGCEGLAVTSGQHLMMADQPEVFAQSVVDLLQNAQQRMALGRAGRELVETEYSWKRCGDDLIHALEKIMR